MQTTENENQKIDPAFDGGAAQCLEHVQKKIATLLETNLSNEMRAEIIRVAMFEIGCAFHCLREAREHSLPNEVIRLLS
jgi:hypothetical protein